VILRKSQMLTRYIWQRRSAFGIKVNKNARTHIYKEAVLLSPIVIVYSGYWWQIISNPLDPPDAHFSML
jgi:hypothetical protein